MYRQSRDWSMTETNIKTEFGAKKEIPITDFMSNVLKVTSRRLAQEETRQKWKVTWEIRGKKLGKKKKPLDETKCKHLRHAVN